MKNARGVALIKLSTSESPLMVDCAKVEIGNEMIFFFDAEQEDGCRLCTANPPMQLLEWFTLSGASIPIIVADQPN